MIGRNTRIGWIRHGETEWNRLGKIQGTTDIPLSPEGIRQAERLAERLAREGIAGTGHAWQGIASSDLRRARQTAEILAKRLGVPFRTDPRLRERFFGSAEGTTLPERLARWGEDWRRRVPDQEPDEAVTSRGLTFVNGLAAEHPGEAWLVVTHGSFLARLLHALCPQLEDAPIGNVSLTVLERVDGGWLPLLHNSTTHLTDEPA